MNAGSYEPCGYASVVAGVTGMNSVTAANYENRVVTKELEVVVNLMVL